MTIFRTTILIHAATIYVRGEDGGVIAVAPDGVAEEADGFFNSDGLSSGSGDDYRKINNGRM